MGWNKLLSKLSFCKKYSNKATEQPQHGDREFVLYWYKKTIIKNTNNESIVNYTTPCRTKVFAKTVEAAKDKLTNFALSKTELIILTDQEWKDGGSELQRFTKELEELNKKYSHLFVN